MRFTDLKIFKKSNHNARHVPFVISYLHHLKRDTRLSNCLIITLISLFKDFPMNVNRIVISINVTFAHSPQLTINYLSLSVDREINNNHCAAFHNYCAARI